jgi:predicted RNA-binding Zn-ribbon protein involved in translation (DUF1610 family)
MIYPMYCTKCDHKLEVRGTVDEYEAVIKVMGCPKCGTRLRRDFSSDAQNPYRPVIEFRPGYVYALGRHCDTKREMFNEAAKQGVELNRSY